jgi:nucleotide-binding universal stress UspA family protein
MNGPIRKILVHIDGTEEAIAAAQYAVCLVRSTGASLTALYVVNTKALSDLVKARIFLRQEQEEYERDLRADAERYLNHVRELAEAKKVSVHTQSVTGSVHQEIVSRIKQEGIDLLVVGELSRIRSRRDEFYDETERAMRAAPCPVLIVKDADRVWELYSALE